MRQNQPILNQHHKQRRDPDLSAVIIKRRPEVADSLFAKPQFSILDTILNNKSPFHPNPLLSPLVNSTKKSFDGIEDVESLVKKQRLTNRDFNIVVNKPSPSLSAKSGDDLVPKLVLKENINKQVKREESRPKLDNNMFIGAFAKGIFRYALSELGKKPEKVRQEEIAKFGAFALLHSDNVSTIEQLRGIWAIGKDDSEVIANCKKLFIEFSIIFFSDEKIIIEWVEDPGVKSIIKKVYANYKEAFHNCLIGPLIAQARELERS